MAIVKEVRGRYSNGVIEPLESLELEEGTEVTISVPEVLSAAERRAAFRSAAGGWVGLVDTDKLLRGFKESREIKSRDVRL